MEILLQTMDTKKALSQLAKIKRLNKKHNIRLAAQWPSKYKILIATILSAQTKDETTIEVCKTLFKKYPTMLSLAKASPKEILKIIRPINYSPKKSKFLSATAKVLMGKSIPKKVEDLLKLPGVGRKVANVYLAEAYGSPSIGVDTHVKRISKKLGWTKNENPDKIEKDLEKLFPKKYWNSINDTLVRFGKTYGLKRKEEDEILKKL